MTNTLPWSSRTAKGRSSAKQLRKFAKQSVLSRLLCRSLKLTGSTSTGARGAAAQVRDPDPWPKALRCGRWTLSNRREQACGELWLDLFDLGSMGTFRPVFTIDKFIALRGETFLQQLSTPLLFSSCVATSGYGDVSSLQRSAMLRAWRILIYRRC